MTKSSHLSVIAGVIACGVLVTDSAGAQTKTPADGGAAAAAAEPLPPPAPELASFMKELLGNWTCITTFAPTAMGPDTPEIKTSSKIKLSKDPTLGGFFYRADYTIAKGKGMPAGISGFLQLGYDAILKLAISIGADNMGTASLGTGPLTETSVSWSGESHVMGMKMKFRETFTKTAPKQMTNVFEVDIGKGFEKMGENVCKR